MNTIKFIIMCTAIISAVVLFIGVVGYCALLVYSWCLKHEHHNLRTRDEVLQEMRARGEEVFTDSETDGESSIDLGSSEDW